MDASPSGRLALELSNRLPGNFYYSGRGSITWLNGSRSVTLIMDRAVDSVIDGRRIVEALTGSVHGWTIGQLAKELVAWIGPPDRTSTRQAIASLKDYWKFCLCTPCTSGDAALYDLESCFYSILSRVKTVRPYFSTRGLLWLDAENPAEETRFRLLVGAVKDHKALRNALIGAMVGGIGETSSQYWHKGRMIPFKTIRGPRVELGAAVVRSAYEIVQLEAQASSAFYANTDSIIISGDKGPKIWPMAGLPFRLLARGEADVQAFGQYRVGHKATKSYNPGSGFPAIEHNPELVEPIYCPWLLSA